MGKEDAWQGPDLWYCAVIGRVSAWLTNERAGLRLVWRHEDGAGSVPGEQEQDEGQPAGDTAPLLRGGSAGEGHQLQDQHPGPGSDCR